MRLNVVIRVVKASDGVLVLFLAPGNPRISEVFRLSACYNPSNSGMTASMVDAITRA
jgi:hypothetical protein